MPGPQSFNSIKVTTSNITDNDILLTEVGGYLNVNNSPLAISGNFGASDLSSFDFNGNPILGFDASIIDTTSTSYTLSSDDSGKIICIEHASNITVTVPTGLSTGFNCTFIQKGSGNIVFSENGTTINNRQSHTKTAGQYAVASLLSYSSNIFILTGDTAT